MASCDTSTTSMNTLSREQMKNSLTSAPITDYIREAKCRTRRRYNKINMFLARPSRVVGIVNTLRTTLGHAGVISIVT